MARVSTLPSLEAQRFRDVLALRGGLAQVEPARLAEVVEELRAPRTDLRALHDLGMADEAAVAHRGLERAAAAERVGLVGHAALVDRLPHVAVALEIVNRRQRAVDRDLGEV